MSVKTTQRISRARATALILSELYNMSNDQLANILDVIADSGNAKVISAFDNFIVSDYNNF